MVRGFRPLNRRKPRLFTSVICLFCSISYANVVLCWDLGSPFFTSSATPITLVCCFRRSRFVKKRSIYPRRLRFCTGLNFTLPFEMRFVVSSMSIWTCVKWLIKCIDRLDCVICWSHWCWLGYDNRSSKTNNRVRGLRDTFKVRKEIIWSLDSMGK